MICRSLDAKKSTVYLPNQVEDRELQPDRLPYQSQRHQARYPSSSYSRGTEELLGGKPYRSSNLSQYSRVQYTVDTTTNLL